LLLIAAFLLLAGSVAQAAQLNKVAAVVNGQAITMFDLQKAATPALAQARINPDDPAQKAALDSVLRRTLDMMIIDILFAQEAKRLKIEISPADVDKEIAARIKAHNMTREQFDAQMARTRGGLTDLRNNITKDLIRQKIMGVEVARRVVVTPQEIKNYYEAHKDQMYNKQGLHMALIVYRPGVNAWDIANRIKSGAMSFAEASQKYSIVPSPAKERGGDMGPVNWEQLNPEWEARLNSMKPGDVTEVFDLQGRKAQVRLYNPTGDNEYRPLTLEEATPRIDAILRQPKAKERFEEYTTRLRNNAVIDVRI
jgi:peptidyl-prolyl cis-trans isomerase SurA